MIIRENIYDYRMERFVANDSVVSLQKPIPFERYMVTCEKFLYVFGRRTNWQLSIYRCADGRTCSVASGVTRAYEKHQAQDQEPIFLIHQS